MSASGGQENYDLAPLKCRDGSRPNVLLAEDSPAARVLTGALLNRIGCDVDAAEHGEEALSFIKDSRYDLILMDIEMPVMDGVVAAREIRTMGGEAAKTPIVALSAFLADTQKSAFWKKHFDLSLPKPADKRQLHALISEVLNDSEKQPELRGENRQINNGPAEIVEEEKLARIFSNINCADRIALLRIASEEILKYARELENGGKLSDGCKIDKALHKLCGLSATFAATALYELVVEMRQKPVVGDSDGQIATLCKCADETSEYLYSKIGLAQEVEI